MTATSPSAAPVRRRRTARSFDARAVAALLAVAAAAWGALWWWSTQERLHTDHGAAAGTGVARGTLLFTSGWVLMLAATMLPGTARLVSTFATMVRNRPDRPLLVGLVVSGYLLVWTAVGVVALAGDRLLHRVVHAVPALDRRPWVVLVAALTLAAAFQLSAFKHRCLHRCRSPHSFVIGHWHGRRATLEALALGADHGRFCVGCCAALMTVMFAAGMGNMAVMVGLAVVMTAEKVLPRGERLTRPVSAGLLVTAVTVAAANLT